MDKLIVREFPPDLNHDDGEVDVTIPTTKTDGGVFLHNVLIAVFITFMAWYVLYYSIRLVLIGMAGLDEYFYGLTLFCLCAVPALLRWSDDYKNEHHEEVPQYHTIRMIDTWFGGSRFAFEGDNTTMAYREAPEMSKGFRNYIHLKTTLAAIGTERIQVKSTVSDEANEKEGGIMMNADLFVAMRPDVLGLDYAHANSNLKKFNSVDLEARIQDGYKFIFELYSTLYKSLTPKEATDELAVDKKIKEDPQFKKEINAYRKMTGSILVFRLFNSIPDKEVQDILNKQVLTDAAKEALKTLLSGKKEMTMSKDEAEWFVQQVYAGMKRVKMDGSDGPGTSNKLLGLVNV